MSPILPELIAISVRSLTAELDKAMSLVVPESERGTRSLVHYDQP